MKRMRLTLEVESRVHVIVSDNTYSLWQKWNESRDDEDWETFVEAAEGEIDVSDLEFWIEDAEPIG